MAAWMYRIEKWSLNGGHKLAKWFWGIFCSHWKRWKEKRQMEIERDS